MNYGKDAVIAFLEGDGHRHPHGDLLDRPTVTDNKMRPFLQCDKGDVVGEYGHG